LGSKASMSPPRCRLRLDALLVLGITGLITAAPLLPQAAGVGTSVLVGCITALAWVTRSRAAAPLGLFCVVCLGLAVVGVRYSQLVLGVGLLVYAWIIRQVAWLQGAATWMRKGSFGGDVRLMIMACSVVAAMALGAWYALFRPDVDDIVAAYVPAAPVGLLVIGGLMFSMINAAVEEGAYRGVIQHGLESTLGFGMAALALQAIAFGALHINGFPRGWVGVGLATIYGLMMGVVRRRSGGMLAPWLAHVLIDIVIAGIIVTLHRPRVTGLGLFG
jgi:membrane protease YdiL (CAAX protease family)